MNVFFIERREVFFFAVGQCHNKKCYRIEKISCNDVRNDVSMGCCDDFIIVMKRSLDFELWQAILTNKKQSYSKYSVINNSGTVFLMSFILDDKFASYIIMEFVIPKQINKSN